MKLNNSAKHANKAYRTSEALDKMVAKLKNEVGRQVKKGSLKAAHVPLEEVG
jgi:hypothetical protein